MEDEQENTKDMQEVVECEEDGGEEDDEDLYASLLDFDD